MNVRRLMAVVAIWLALIALSTTSIGALVGIVASSVAVTLGAPLAAIVQWAASLFGVSTTLWEAGGIVLYALVAGLGIGIVACLVMAVAEFRRGYRAEALRRAETAVHLVAAPLTLFISYSSLWASK